MGKKLVFIFTLAITILFLSGCSLFSSGWTYTDLPQGYELKKINDTEMVIGKEVEGNLEIELEGKTIGIEKYIAEFQTSDNYIGLKALENNEDSVSVLFYIIDAKNEDVYGPYETEATYNAVVEKIVDEELGEWNKTIDINENGVLVPSEENKEETSEEE